MRYAKIEFCYPDNDNKEILLYYYKVTLETDP